MRKTTVYLATLLTSLILTSIFVTKVSGFQSYPITPPTTPTVTPSPTSLVTPTLTPTPPRANTPPKIYPRRRLLKIVRKDRYFKTWIIARDKEDRVKVTIKGLPDGASYKCIERKNHVVCKIEGRIKRLGIYRIRVVARDERGRTTWKNYLLLVRR